MHSVGRGAPPGGDGEEASRQGEEEVRQSYARVVLVLAIDLTNLPARESFI